MIKTVPSFQLFDATLRDGSYNVDFSVDEDFATQYLKQADCSGVSHIDLGHGVGIDAERVGHRKSHLSIERWADVAKSSLSKTPWGMFSQPSFTTKSSLDTLYRKDMDFIRIGIHPHQVKDNIEYIHACIDRFPNVYVNLMKSSAYTAETIVEAASTIPRQVSGIYVVDSFGSMLPSEVRKYTLWISQHHEIVGFHGHNNLGLANINSLMAIQSGACLIDGTSGGVGRGAGNADLEALAAIAERTGDERFNVDILSQLSTFTIKWLSKAASDRESDVLAGRFGIHSEKFNELRERASLDNITLYQAMRKICSVPTVENIF